MENSFFESLQRLELMAFFSGYPLVYTILRSILLTQPSKDNFRSRLFLLLPFAYAILGTLYLGLQLKNLYAAHSIGLMRLSTWQHFLKVWGILAVLFWIPALGRKPILSLGHSLVFFFLLVRDMILQISGSYKEGNMVRNDMQMYTLSLFLSLGAFLLIALCYFLYVSYRKRYGP